MKADQIASGLAKFAIALTVAASGLDQLAESFRRTKEAMERLGKHRSRQDWWKRSEGPPNYIADVNDPEWWQGGDEPPAWGCAA